jgi:hypothetical protein
MEMPYAVLRKIDKPNILFQENIVRARPLPASRGVGSWRFVMNNVLQQCGLPYRTA